MCLYRNTFCSVAPLYTTSTGLRGGSRLRSMFSLLHKTPPPCSFPSGTVFVGHCIMFTQQFFWAPIKCVLVPVAQISCCSVSAVKRKKQPKAQRQYQLMRDLRSIQSVEVCQPVQTLHNVLLFPPFALRGCITCLWSSTWAGRCRTP